MEVKRKSERTQHLNKVGAKRHWANSLSYFLVNLYHVICQQNQQKKKGFPVVLSYQTGNLKESKKHFVSYYLSF